jgi:hypothetical protein
LYGHAKIGIYFATKMTYGLIGGIRFLYLKN